jgi:hypothetical protein
MNPNPSSIGVFVIGAAPIGGLIQPSNLSGAYHFMPTVGECVLNAFSRIRIRGPMVLAEHLHMAFMESNLLQVEFSVRGPTLWTTGALPVFQSEPGVPTYPVPPGVMMITNCTIGIGDPPDEQELTITPMSRTEYVMYPNKLQQGRPTSYWYDRSIASTLTLWPCPDQAYNVHLWGFMQMQDASLRNGVQFQAPYRALDAICAGMAARLAVHYAQDLEATRQAQYDRAYGFYASQDTEDAAVYIVPMLAGYFQ